MGRGSQKLNVDLTLNEAAKLAQHLSTLIGKGSISTTPSWARKIIFKIGRAAREQYPE